MLKNNKNSYTGVAKFFHWTIGLLMIVMLIFGYFMTGSTMVNIHKLTGLIILCLALCSIVWTLTHKHPKLPAKTPWYEKTLARTVQGLLYICMFAMPLSGWAMATAFGFAPHIGSLRLPMPGITADPVLGAAIVKIHVNLAIGLIVFICLHFAGALKHHFIGKDDVLRKMLPFRKVGS